MFNFNEVYKIPKMTPAQIEIEQVQNTLGIIFTTLE